jgi:hypothetical protein
MAPKFFFVCAGLLCLALAYHLGASRAGAQASAGLVAINQATADIYAVDAVGNIYAGEPCYGNPRPFVHVGQMPAGCVPTSICANSNGTQTFVGCANGDIYRLDDAGYPNVSAGFCGNIYGRPTPARQVTWGSVKMRHR